jgi:hypothetical protein
VEAPGSGNGLQESGGFFRVATNVSSWIPGSRVSGILTLNTKRSCHAVVRHLQDEAESSWCLSLDSSSTDNQEPRTRIPVMPMRIEGRWRWGPRKTIPSARTDRLLLPPASQMNHLGNAQIVWLNHTITVGGIFVVQKSETGGAKLAPLYWPGIETPRSFRLRPGGLRRDGSLLATGKFLMTEVKDTTNLRSWLQVKLLPSDRLFRITIALAFWLTCGIDGASSTRSTFLLRIFFSDY